MYYTIDETRGALKAGKITSVQLVQNAIDTFNKDKSASIPLNAFIEMYDDAVSKAEAADKLISQAKANGTLDKLFSEKPLLGLPFANKDNINCKGHRLTCASKILEGYVAPYNATVIERLENAGAIPLGRCNRWVLLQNIQAMAQPVIRSTANLFREVLRVVLLRLLLLIRHCLALEQKLVVLSAFLQATAVFMVLNQLMVY